MRRALIPVLTRMKDFSGGVDQYIEVLNRYPEDEALAREAALYASANGEARKLRDYYAKTATDSPKDFRWPMVLARIETQLEDYPAAISSFTRAAVVRPDRQDLLTARLNLEERLLRFDEAAASAEKLYELTYRNPQWMEKLAELRARQRQTTAAVTALNKAWIEGHPDRAENFFKVAQRLESWSLLAEARRFAEEGLKRSPGEGLPIYSRILTRMRDYDVVFVRLAAAKPEVAGPAAREVGNAVAQYYSPEEKVKFATALEKQPRRLDVAVSAGLVNLEAKWRYERMMAKPGSPESEREKQRLVQLQRQRLQFDELGGQLEAYDKALPPDAQHTGDLDEAAACFRASGNTAAELRVLERTHFDGPMLDRYCQLLLPQPQKLVAAIAAEGRAQVADAMLNYVLQHANAAIAQQAVAARGQKTGLLWTKAYTSLAGLYYASPATPARAAFTGILGDMTIGPRIGKPADRDQQLAGDLWFYYGGRFGEYLDSTRQAGAADYLPAMVEATPGRSEAYFTLAEYSGSAEDYRNALELNPARADVHDRLAVIAAKAGRADEAVQEWRLALGAFTQMMNRARVPQKFWGDLSDTLHHVGDAKLLAALHDDVDKLLRLYIRRNGSFQVDGLMEGAFFAAGDSTAGVTWIAELSSAAANPVQFLERMIERPWIPEAQKDLLYRRLIDSAQAQVSQMFGEQQTSALTQLWSLQIGWTEYLLGRRENDRARQLIASIPAEARKQRASEIISLEIRIAARMRTLATQLAKYQEPSPLAELRNAANDLVKDGDAASARRVLEFVYEHEIRAGNFDVSNFLGLAEVHLEDKDTPGAVALLRRMTLVSGEAFKTLDPAAALLEKTAHAAEAAVFLAELVKAEPWNADARERLAAAQGSTATLVVVAKSGDAPYATRVAAALGLRKLKGEVATGTDAELVLLSGQAALTDTEVSKPYFAASRVEAAVGPLESREKLLLGAIAIDPKLPKLPLFRAALEARHDDLAVAVGRQILPQYFSEEAEFNEWVANGFLSGLAPAERLDVARGLGEAQQRLGNLRAAALYYQIAERIQPSQAVRTALERVKAQIEINAKNELRRPVVSENLEQDRLVRPRVVAR
jgi:tetratricopeptide (TPR) repeat protein